MTKYLLCNKKGENQGSLELEQEGRPMKRTKIHLVSKNGLNSKFETALKKFFQEQGLHIVSELSSFTRGKNKNKVTKNKRFPIFAKRRNCNQEVVLVRLENGE